MIDHISVGVSDLERSARFYEATLATLGLTRLVTRPATVGFGKDYPEFWINLRKGMARLEEGSGTHICLRAKTTTEVDAFHAAALVLAAVVMKSRARDIDRAGGKERDALLARVAAELARAEKQKGDARRAALTQLATSLGQDAAMSSDQPKVQKLVAVVTDLASVTGNAAQ